MSAISHWQVSLQMCVAFREVTRVGGSHFACRYRLEQVDLRSRCCMIVTGVWACLVHQCGLGAVCRMSVTTVRVFAVQVAVRFVVYSRDRG
jgi:hypothetical protein